MERVDGMSIGNVNSAWIGAYPYAGKAQRNNAAKAAGFAEAIGQAGQKDSVGQTAAGSEKPVFRWLYSADGSTGEVYQAQDYTPEHPVYRVKSWDAAGNLTEQVIDVSKVNPRDCNTYEMYAYAADLKETGEGSFEETVLRTATAKAAAGAERQTGNAWDFSKSIDWTEAVRELMRSAYASGDFKGYMGWLMFLGFLK